MDGEDVMNACLADDSEACLYDLAQRAVDVGEYFGQEFTSDGPDGELVLFIFLVELSEVEGVPCLHCFPDELHSLLRRGINRCPLFLTKLENHS